MKSAPEQVPKLLNPHKAHHEDATRRLVLTGGVIAPVAEGPERGLKVLFDPMIGWFCDLVCCVNDFVHVVVSNLIEGLTVVIKIKDGTDWELELLNETERRFLIWCLCAKYAVWYYEIFPPHQIMEWSDKEGKYVVAHGT